MDYSEKRELPARDIKEITTEIKELQRQAKNIVLMYAVEIGRNLAEAKSVLKHGEWGEWLRTEVEFSQSSANNYMKLYEQYGSGQMSLFGNVANSQSIANLPYTKALQLLAVPEEERQEFVESHTVEDMSVKELQEAIRERDKARQEADTAKKIAKACEDETRMAKEEANNAMINAQRIIDAAMAEATARADDLEARLRNTQNQLQEAQKTAGEIPEDKLEEIREEARILAEGEAEKKIVEQRNRAERTKESLLAKTEEAEKAEIRAKNAEKCLEEEKAKADKLAADLEQLKKKQEAGTNMQADVAAFKALFEQLQDLAEKMEEKLERIALEDQDLALKLKRAMKAFGETL